MSNHPNRLSKADRQYLHEQGWIYLTTSSPNGPGWALIHGYCGVIYSRLDGAEALEITKRSPHFPGASISRTPRPTGSS